LQAHSQAVNNLAPAEAGEPMRIDNAAARRSVLQVAALSLFGWYLMVPPRIPGTGQINQSAPRSQWIIRRTFPHQEGCLAARDRLRTDGRNRIATKARGRAGSGQLRWCIECSAQCVSADDPSLKEK
jgi:hypothetical protein